MNAQVTLQFAVSPTWQRQLKKEGFFCLSVLGCSPASLACRKVAVARGRSFYRKEGKGDECSCPVPFLLCIQCGNLGPRHVVLTVKLDHPTSVDMISIISHRYDYRLIFYVILGLISIGTINCLLINLTMHSCPSCSENPETCKNVLIGFLNLGRKASNNISKCKWWCGNAVHCYCVDCSRSRLKAAETQPRPSQVTTEGFAGYCALCHEDPHSTTSEPWRRPLRVPRCGKHSIYLFFGELDKPLGVWYNFVEIMQSSWTKAKVIPSLMVMRRTFIGLPLNESFLPIWPCGFSLRTVTTCECAAIHSLPRILPGILLCSS